mmetsp:Transcript_21498/g.60023  ORF Transcript_21498/g.60023 Transcript_21498/m.60023 type:complete len:205 (-) Transcript_21498:144-758(-)
MSTPNEVASITSSGFFLAFMRLGSVAYRGSLSRRSAVTTAGKGIVTSWMPASTSLATFSDALSAATSTFEAEPACGQPMSPARSAPVWLLSSSIACLPMSTIEGFSFSTTLAMSFATARGCSSWSVLMGVFKWIARSAPIASACRSVSAHLSGPAETATSSFTWPFSFSRMPSSTAISQKGFIDILTLSSSTAVMSFFTRTLTA